MLSLQNISLMTLQPQGEGGIDFLKLCCIAKALLEVFPGSPLVQFF